MIPTEDYTVTRSMWEDYYTTQLSNKINMIRHPLVGFFMKYNAWRKCFDHFETEGKTDCLIIEVKV